MDINEESAGEYQEPQRSFISRWIIELCDENIKKTDFILSDPRVTTDTINVGNYCLYHWLLFECNVNYGKIAILSHTEWGLDILLKYYNMLV